MTQLVFDCVAIFLNSFSQMMKTENELILHWNYYWQPNTVGNVDHILKFGYFLMTVTILLMVWCSYARAATREIEQVHYPPCSFNPLCSCSKPAPDLGIVQCRNVPFPSIPNSVNTSKVFMLHMERTGLRELESYFFQATGKNITFHNYVIIV